VPARDDRLSAELAGATMRGGERRAIELIERALGRAALGGARVERGIGDDAAILLGRRTRLVFTVDTAVDGVHFDRRWLSLGDVGFRSFQAAVSDLAAMGARPLAALSSLILPRATSERALAAIAHGQGQAARSLRCPIVGGNLARGSELSVTTSVLGEVERPLTRDGARPGDALWLIGDVGLARAGYELLRRARARATRGASAFTALPSARARAIAAWRRPLALIDAGSKLVGRATSAIDVSDGLSTDVRHVATASGVRVVIVERELRRVLRPAFGAVCAELGVDGVTLALLGGEDYALLATGPVRKKPRFAHMIGRVERGSGAFLERESGETSALSAGFDHLSV
jgi:thiamine-monophosphate kinase